MPLRIAIIVNVFLVTHGGGLAARPRFYLCCRSAVSRHIWGVSGEQLRTCFAGGVVATSFHTLCAPLLRHVLALLIRFSHKSNPKTGVF